MVKRVIHTTADFDYARNLRFTPRAVEQAVKALHAGAVIVTDTNMALAGITKPGLAKLGGSACCYMADPEVAAAAKRGWHHPGRRSDEKRQRRSIPGPSSPSATRPRLC